MSDNLLSLIHTHTHTQLDSVNETAPRLKYDISTVTTQAPTPVAATAKTPTQQSIVQAVYTDPNGQPVYILQNSPALIPFQFQQPGAFPTTPAHTTLTNSVQAAVTIPSTLKLDQSKAQQLALSSPVSMSKSVTVSQTFNPPTLDSLIQPRMVPHTNGGLQPSDAGPIRSHSRQAVRERPSPVPVDGECRHSYNVRSRGKFGDLLNGT